MVTKLCEVCSKVDMELLTHQLHPCRNPLPCLYPPYKRRDETYLVLGSVDEIKSRRSTCDLCRLIAEALDKEPSDLGGTCRITENEEYCSFTLPRNVEARDPGVTHFHLTQASVIFDTSIPDDLFGPPLPWVVKEWDDRRPRYILHFQIKGGRDSEAIDLTAASMQPDRGVLDIIGGRYVGPQLNPQLIEGDGQPTFVIDVIQSCLVESPSRCRYVALSYVWGTATVFKHLLENTQDLRKPGSLRSLPIPTTIRDAITLVRLIGERYLWVDSLCIVQNDQRMQQEEIMRMGTIYSGALFTIIAAAGDHADTGLPGVERGSREQTQKTLKFGSCELLTVINILRFQGGIDNTIWASRAWTFQERILSNRLLVFSERQVYWNCRSASLSEERVLEEVQDIDWHRPPFPQSRLSDEYLSWEPLQSVEYCDLYHDLVYNYRQRRLTYQTDILNAFNGVAEILGKRQGDTLFWAIPGSHFSHTLTWEFLGHAKRNNIEVPIFKSDGSKEMVPIPSWSWAAWSGEELIHLNEFLDATKNRVRPVVQFHIVDKNHELVKIEDRSREGNPGHDVRAVAEWEDPQLQEVQLHSTSCIGQLHFWTSLANVRAVRREWIDGARRVDYFLNPDPDFRANTNTTEYIEVVRQQDFIVVAGRGTRKLILLAVEWRDGVVYRVGKTEVEEAHWLAIENRQWRLITMG
ncbi:heterokaryon incompatibility protein-domain-containing protein [Chiua virens]|nr:heterokaryon incompatibility protein-domain-containing protein [Chiua virens]